MKRKLIRFLEIAAYYSGADELFYWLNCKAKRILCFHHVLSDDVFVPDVNGFEMSETEFRNCIQELKKRYKFSTDVTDVGTLTITFDDGWRNEYTTAARVLKEEGDIPAILFISGELIDNKDPLRALRGELVEHWLKFVPFGCYDVNLAGESYHIELTDDSKRAELGKLLRSLHRKDVEARGRGLLKALDDAYAVSDVLKSLQPKYVVERLTGIRMAELEDLRSRGWTIGWHTQSHFPLKLLSPEDQRAELTPAEGIGKEVMAYPYGSPDAVDDVTRSIVAELGYGKALSFMTEPGQPYDSLFYPRHLVSSDKYALHFVLSGAKNFLKYHRLFDVV